MLHSVTVTAGPRGFSSPWTSNGSFSFTPRTKGTYQIFCSLHPSQMVQVVKVR
jgi:plastocyanin